jgi:peptide/nickel transport system permease protein
MRRLLKKEPDPFKIRIGNRGRIGLLLFFLIVLAALGADLLAPHDPWQRFEPYQPPSRDHLLGTNDIGNDILSELIHGSRVSLIVGFGAALLATLLGLIIGLVSGYFRGVVEEMLMGLTDIFLMIPRIPLIIILAAFLKPSFWMIGLALGLLWWTSTARVVRSKTLQIREMSFIESSRCLGFRKAHIIFSDVLPNIIHVVIPKFMITVATAMISEASLSFLGLGDPTLKSWGMMINFAFVKGGFINQMWWWYLPPGICIVGVVLTIVWLGFGYEQREERFLRGV